MSEVLGQSDDTKVVPFDAKAFAQLIDGWEEIESDGEEPGEGVEATGSSSSPSTRGSRRAQRRSRTWAHGDPSFIGWAGRSALSCTCSAQWVKAGFMSRSGPLPLSVLGIKRGKPVAHRRRNAALGDETGYKPRRRDVERIIGRLRLRWCDLEGGDAAIG